MLAYPISFGAFKSYLKNKRKMPFLKSTYDEYPLEARFYIYLGLYVQIFGLLEANIGSFLRLFIRDPKEREKVNKLQLHQKLFRLEECIQLEFATRKPKLASDFTLWISDLAKIRESRNKHVHGIWLLNRMCPEAPVEFKAISIFEGTGKPIPVDEEFRNISFAEFKAIVSNLESAFFALNNLRNKHNL